MRVSHNSLREELPKLPWDEGFWSDFFKPVVTTDDLVAFPKFDRATPPVEYLKEALEADDQPGPKRARKVANVTFERVVLNRAVISWRDQREADMSRALVKWCAVLESWNSEVATVTSSFMRRSLLRRARISLEITWPAKRPALVSSEPTAC